MTSPRDRLIEIFNKWDSERIEDESYADWVGKLADAILAEFPRLHMDNDPDVSKFMQDLARCYGWIPLKDAPRYCELAQLKHDYDKLEIKLKKEYEEADEK